MSDISQEKSLDTTASTSSEREPATSVQDVNAHRSDPENGQLSHTSVEKLEEEWKAGRREWLIMVVFLIVSLMASIDATILVSALPALASDLHGTAIDAFWAGTSYLLASAIFQPILVSLSDIFGRQHILFLSVLLFTVGTIICCTSNNFTQFLAGRSVQGIGGGGIINLVLVIITDIIPLRQRPKYNSLIQAAWAFGTVAGPLIGGAIVEHTTWRWIFYLNFPCCAVSLVMIPLVLKMEISVVSSFGSKLTRIDWVGATLFVASLTVFLMGITWGGVQFSWNSYQTLLPILLGLLGLCLTLAWEVWGTNKPFLRLGLFNSRSAYLAYFCALLQGLLMFGGLYYMPFYLASCKSMSPVRTGVGLLPVTVSLLPTSIANGVIMTKTGKFRWSLWSGWAFMCVAYGLLILLDENSSTVRWVFIFITAGFAHGLILMPMIYCVQAMAQLEDVGYAAAMYAFLRTCGQCFGVALGGAVFQNQLEKHVASTIAKNAEGFLATLKALPLTSAFRMQVTHAYGLAFHGVFELMVGIAALGLVCSLGIGKFSMDRQNVSQHILKKT